MFSGFVERGVEFKKYDENSGNKNIVLRKTYKVTVSYSYTVILVYLIYCFTVEFGSNSSFLFV